eukprot:CAMPEP_0113268240 /NCGR_PEP_ID=MMETSP0008_2-20120614/21059_1 /TAXON_ID=97485 /ORGANISM="Prymnesium parvum" /LENGTH=77 /DNA_ID=CAMNT_0000117371 /DNA_START=321 /DNA_END=553 /DNA_ORIENTATION=+ /assembly_acc=CAM_ASM_000153
MKRAGGAQCGRLAHRRSACEGGTADVVFATRDHSAADAAEIDRITSAGGEGGARTGMWWHLRMRTLLDAIGGEDDEA